MNSSYFPPTFEFWNWDSALKILLKWSYSNSRRYSNTWSLSKSILMAKTMKIKNLKIQMLAGNSLNSFLDLRSEKTTTLVNCHEFYTLFKKFTKNFFSLDKSILQIRDWLALLESMIKKDRADMSDSGHIYHMLERQKVSFLVFFACRFHGIFCGLSEKWD